MGRFGKLDTDDQVLTRFPLAKLATMVLTTVGCGLLALAPVPAAAETYSILANHGNGWINQGEHNTLAGCDQEAARLSASFPKAQFGCLETSALRAYEAQQATARRAYELQQESQRATARQASEFEQATARCARRSGVQHNPKPDSRVTILGTERQRFNFDKCMTQAGQDLR